MAEMRLVQEYYSRGARRTEAFEPPAGGTIVSVEWDDEVAVVTWLVPAHVDGTVAGGDDAAS